MIRLRQLGPAFIHHVEAYGLLVAVFQHGWGASLFGFQQVEVITDWLPATRLEDLAVPMRIATTHLALAAQSIPERDALLYEDSLGRLCIAENQGSAGRRLGLTDDRPVSIRRA